jgi:hypothetical protein
MLDLLEGALANFIHLILTNLKSIWCAGFLPVLFLLGPTGHPEISHPFAMLQSPPFGWTISALPRFVLISTSFRSRLFPNRGLGADGAGEGCKVVRALDAF